LFEVTVKCARCSKACLVRSGRRIKLTLNAFLNIFKGASLEKPVGGTKVPRSYNCPGKISPAGRRVSPGTKVFTTDRGKMAG